MWEARAGGGGRGGGGGGGGGGERAVGEESGKRDGLDALGLELGL